MPPPKPARPSSPLAKGALLKHPLKGGKEGGAHEVWGAAPSVGAGTEMACTGVIIEADPYAVHSTVPANAPGAEHLK